MERNYSRLATSGVFAIIIAFTVFRRGSGLVVSLGAGLLAGGIYYFISHWLQQ